MNPAEALAFVASFFGDPGNTSRHDGPNGTHITVENPQVVDGSVLVLLDGEPFAITVEAI